MKVMKKPLIFLFILLMVLSFTIIIQAAEPTDITNHWAQDYILNMTNNEIMNIYPDGSFKPEQPITRGEFTVALAKQMGLSPVSQTKFEDMNGYPGYKFVNALVEEKIINGYPDNTFKPEKQISRAEVVTLVLKSLGIKNEEETIYLDDFQPFEDVPENHWALNHIKIADKLDFVYADSNNRFYPKRTMTRATAAKYLNKLSNLNSSTGYIADVYPTTGSISVNLINGERKIFNYDNNALIGRNNRMVELDEILETDKVFVINNNTMDIKYLKAYGMVTEEDLTTEISKITDGIVEPAEVKELSEGNISILKPKVITGVKNQLLNQGLSEAEVNAIMTQKWSDLEELSRARLAETVAIQTGLPLDITKSLLSGNWEKIKTYAQIEVVQRMVREILRSDLVS